MDSYRVPTNNINSLIILNNSSSLFLYSSLSEFILDTVLIASINNSKIFFKKESIFFNIFSSKLFLIKLSKSFVFVNGPLWSGQKASGIIAFGSILKVIFSSLNKYIALSILALNLAFDSYLA